MKLLFLHPKSWTEEHVLLRHLAATGDGVCALEESRDLDGARRLSDDFAVPGDGVRTMWYHPGRGAERLFTWIADRWYRAPFDGRNLVHRMWVIREAVGRFRPDVVICSDGFSYAIPAAFLRRAGLLRQPVIGSYIGGDVLDVPEAELGRRRTPRVEALLRESIAALDVLRPVSPILAEELKRLGADAAKIEVVPSHLSAPIDALEEVRGRKASLRTGIRRRYGIPEDAPVIITLGNNFRAKGLHLLAAAWPRIAAAHPAARWLLAGPDDLWLARGVRPMIAGRTAVIETGRLAQRDVFEHLAAADLLVVPSIAEGLNVVAVEAAAVSTPCIVSTRAGVAPWVSDAGSGAAVRPDAEAFGEAVSAALADRAKLRAWRSRCPEMVKPFLIPAVAARLRAIAGRLAGRAA